MTPGALSRLARTALRSASCRTSRHLSVKSSGDPVAARQRQIDLEARWQKFPMPKENLEFRAATLADKRQVLSIEPDIHYGLDYMDDYFDEIVTDRNRCGVVAVDKASGNILSFGYAVIGHEGRNVSYAGGRTRQEVRAFGLAAVTTRALYELIKPRMHPAAYCSGVYALPGHTRGYFDRLRGLIEVVLHNQQLGFESGAAYWTELARRFAASHSQPGGEDEPRLVDRPVEFLSSEAVCSGPENRLLKPGQYLLVGKESLTCSRGNFVIWEGHLKQVMSSQSDSGEVTGVSIANVNSVPIGGHHLVINVYCRSEACAVSHVIGQLRSAVQQLKLSDSQRHRVFVSVFVPSHLLYNELLSSIRVHPLVKDLPQSLSPKLACDIRIGAWAPGTYV